MKDYNYHGLFYYRVISLLQGLKDGNGSPLSSQHEAGENDPEFVIAYEPRQPGGYQFTYMRDDFLAHRDRFVIAQKGRGYVVLLRESNNGNNVSVYKDAIKYLFPDDTDKAYDELMDLLDKFYVVDSTTERSGLDYVDYSTSRSENNIAVDEIL